MKTLKIIMYLFSFTFLISGCDKEDDDTAGLSGPQGPQGPAGTNGTNGTINIITKEFTILAGDWHPYNSSSNSNDSAAVSVPEITQAIVDSGMVVCYRKKGDKYIVMPHTTFDGIAASVFQFWYYTGKIVFTCNSNYVGGNTMGTEKYKVVIASGQVKLPAQYTEFENIATSQVISF